MENVNRSIEIVGGGLAGLSLGIALQRRGIAVRVEESGSYPRHRVCGEFINGVSRGTLESLSVAGSLRDALPLRTSAWFRGNDRILEIELPEPALGISRFRLDERLAETFSRLGGELHTGVRRAAEPGEGLVWAAGRRVDSASRWLGLKVHALDMEILNDLEMHLGSGGYVGLARIEGGKTNVCGLFRRRQNLRGRGSELLVHYLEANGLERLAGRLRESKRDEEPFLGVSAIRLGRQESVPGLFALGDADRMIPPFTGNGMSMAFEAAECGIEPLLNYARNDMEWDACVAEVRRHLARRFSKRLLAARMLHPLLFRRSGRGLLATGARTGVLPFRTIFHAIR